jgi:hypothetical protein
MAEERDRKRLKISIWFFIALGVVLGLLMENMRMGLIVGLIIGVVGGSLIAKR